MNTDTQLILFNGFHERLFRYNLELFNISKDDNRKDLVIPIKGMILNDCEYFSFLVNENLLNKNLSLFYLNAIKEWFNAFASDEEKSDQTKYQEIKRYTKYVIIN